MLLSAVLFRHVQKVRRRANLPKVLRVLRFHKVAIILKYDDGAISGLFRGFPFVFMLRQVKADIRMAQQVLLPFFDFSQFLHFVEVFPPLVWVDVKVSGKARQQPSEQIIRYIHVPPLPRLRYLA